MPDQRDQDPRYIPEGVLAEDRFSDDPAPGTKLDPSGEYYLPSGQANWLSDMERVHEGTYGDTAWGQQNMQGVEDQWRDAGMMDPRYRYLDKELMTNWAGEYDAMQNVLAQDSVAAGLQNKSLSDAATMSLAGQSQGGAAAASAQHEQGAQAGGAITDAASQRQAEAQQQLGVMRDTAQRRNEYILSVQDLYNQSLGAAGSKMLQDERQRRLEERQRAKEKAAEEAAAVQAGVGATTSAIALGLAFASDERLKEDVQNVTQSEAPEGNQQGVKIAGKMNTFAGDLVKQFGPGGSVNPIWGHAPQASRPYFDAQPGQYLGRVIAGRTERVSGIESKEDVKKVEGTPKLGGQAPQGPGQQMSDGTQSQISYVINNDPNIMHNLMTGRINQQEAVMLAANKAEGDPSMGPQVAYNMRNLAARMDQREGVSNFANKHGDPFDVLRQRHNHMINMELDAAKAGLSPTYDKKGNFLGYTPGRKTQFAPDKYLKGDELFYENPYGQGTEKKKPSPDDFAQAAWLQGYSPISEAQNMGGSIQEISGPTTMEQIADIDTIKYKYNKKADQFLGKKVSGKQKVGMSADQAENMNADIIGSAGGFKTVKEDEGLGKTIAAGAEGARRIIGLEQALRELERRLL